MITQSEIAKIAGVSRATVERVINNREDVNENTRQKVLEVLKQFDYKPNRAGKTLVIKQRQLKIGVVIIQSSNPFYAELNRGIMEKADEFKTYGIEVIVKKAKFQAQEQIRYIDELLAENVSALVIQPTIEPEIEEKLKETERLGIPVVQVNTCISDYRSSFCYVGNDFYLCGKTAANLMEMIVHDDCRIGIITGFGKAKSHSDRIRGFQDYIRDIDRMTVVAVDENRDEDMESYHVTKMMLEAHPEINAMFLVAGGVYGAGKAIEYFIQEHGRKITTISFDDLPPTRELIRSGIIAATICQQPVRQGRMALSVLLDYLIDGIPPKNNMLYTDIQIKIQSNLEQ